MSTHGSFGPENRENRFELTNEIVTKNNLTTLMITHNMRDALKYGNRLLMLITAG